MASQIVSASNISLSDQHAFIDLAKEFNWGELKRQVNANPELVNIQPSGREGIKRWSALHQAAYSGSADAVKFLLDHDAAVDVTTPDGRTPLDVAKNGQVKGLLLHAMGAKGSKTVPTPLRVGKRASTILKAMKTSRVGKAMKTTVVMKVMKAKKIAKGKGSKALVYKGTFVKTVGGLTKNHLTKSKSGKIVSKKMHDHGKKSYANIRTWVEAFVKARAELSLIGFVAIKKGSPIYLKTTEIYKSS